MDAKQYLCERCGGNGREPDGHWTGTACDSVAVGSCTLCGGTGRSTQKAPAPDPINPAPDPINPPHYRSHPSGVECVTITEAFDFLVGNVIKYAWRAGLKDGASRAQDLRKAEWYARRAAEKADKEQTGRKAGED